MADQNLHYNLLTLPRVPSEVLIQAHQEHVQMEHLVATERDSPPQRWKKPLHCPINTQLLCQLLRCLYSITVSRCVSTTFNDNFTNLNTRVQASSKPTLPEQYRTEILEPTNDQHQSYGNHLTRQNDYKRILNRQKQHKVPVVSCVYRISVCKFVKFRSCNPNLSLPAQAKFHVLPHSCSINICIVTK